MLTIYAPLSNQKSKAWEVFEGIRETWPDEMIVMDNATETEPNSNSMFWGFVNNNLEMVKKLEARQHDYWFTDTPYFGRFDNNNLKPDNHYWRICNNSIHAGFIENCAADRFENFKIEVHDPKKTGDHILICPSSVGINSYLGNPNWTNDTIEKIKKFTDRPIRLRHKPRGRGTSGPSEAKVPLSEDLKNAWACVTSCSIAAVEAVCMGIPVFCHSKSFAVSVGNLKLENIENPLRCDPMPWLYSLAYQQFTPQEYQNGTAINILREKGLV